MTDQEILEKVKSEVEPIYKKIKLWAHGYRHIENVVKAAKDLARMEKADELLCQIAAYCHDLGRLEEEKRGLVDPIPGAPSQHAFFSVAPTKKILDELPISDQDKKLILEAVGIHAVKKYEGDNKIALILQDADRSDGFNKFAILRFGCFNCQIPMCKPKNDLEIDQQYKRIIKIMKQDQSVRQMMIRTLKHVSRWYDVLLNTESARIYLKDGYNSNNALLQKLEAL